MRCRRNELFIIFLCTLKILHLHRHFHQAVQNTLTDRRTVICQQKNIIRFRIHLVGLINIRHHRQGSYTFDTTPVHRFYNLQGALIVLFIRKTGQLLQLALIFCFIQCFHLICFSLINIIDRIKCITLPWECQKICGRLFGKKRTKARTRRRVSRAHAMSGGSGTAAPKGGRIQDGPRTCVYGGHLQKYEKILTFKTPAGRTR